MATSLKSSGFIDINPRLAIVFIYLFLHLSNAERDLKYYAMTLPWSISDCNEEQGFPCGISLSTYYINMIKEVTDMLLLVS